MTTRRGFLKAILAAGVAPYVSTAAGVLMPVKKIVEAPLPMIDLIQAKRTVLNEKMLAAYMEELWRQCTSGGIVRIDGHAWRCQ